MEGPRQAGGRERDRELEFFDDCVTNANGVAFPSHGGKKAHITIWSGSLDTVPNQLAVSPARFFRFLSLFLLSEHSLHLVRIYSIYYYKLVLLPGMVCKLESYLTLPPKSPHSSPPQPNIGSLM